MKIGDLVMFLPVNPPRLSRMGEVPEVFTYQQGELPEGSSLVGLPMASVHWNGLDGPMMHRQDLLEVVNENR